MGVKSSTIVKSYSFKYNLIPVHLPYNTCAMIAIKEFPYSNFKVTAVQGRYVPYDQIITAIKSLGYEDCLEWIGSSVMGHPIPLLTVGEGPTTLLMWSQMHGNESTTTKALLDYLQFLKLGGEDAKAVLSQCTLKIIPVLNPDGANAYTRVNANQVDLNRDAQELTQPESKALSEVFKKVKPHYCFNLHDQRTLFNVGDTSKVATVSFLSPAADPERSITNSRMVSMQLISDMNDMLQRYIPGQVGRYDDSFNINCVGDTFQNAQVPTILFESGHFPGDYEREQTRALICLSIYTAINSIVYDLYSFNDVDAYNAIPENNKLFYDLLIKNPHMSLEDYKPGEAIGINFEEVLVNDHIDFVLKEPEKVPENAFYGHQVYDLKVLKDLESLQSQESIWSKI